MEKKRAFWSEKRRGGRGRVVERSAVVKLVLLLAIAFIFLLGQLVFLDRETTTWTSVTFSIFFGNFIYVKHKYCNDMEYCELAIYSTAMVTSCTMYGFG